MGRAKHSVAISCQTIAQVHFDKYLIFMCCLPYLHNSSLIDQTYDWLGVKRRYWEEYVFLSFSKQFVCLIFQLSFHNVALIIPIKTKNTKFVEMIVGIVERRDYLKFP